MAQEQKKYQVITTKIGRQAFMDLVGYLDKHYTPERANQIAQEILQETQRLKTMPYQGRMEEHLDHREKEYRFILYNRSKGAQVKIVYWIDEQKQTVSISDFFPTEMNPQNIGKTIR